MSPDIQTLTIDRLGAKGDGVAGTESGSLYVPYTLPGEQVSVKVNGNRGELVDVLEPSPDRQNALCHHFGVCGGCALQHLRREFYEDWKRQQVVAAFAAQEIDADVRPLQSIAPGSRRRAVLAARRTKKAVLLGYRASRSYGIVDVDMCPVLSPNIMVCLPHLRDLLRLLLSRKGEAKVTIVDTPAGLDVLIENFKFEDSPSLRAEVSGKAKGAGLARLSIEDDILYFSSSPSIDVLGVRIDQDPRIFLQAVEEAQDVLVEKATSWMRGARRIADLFSGAGTFTFSLAKTAEVLPTKTMRAPFQS